ncbi:MAG TPA: AMP-binding protein [Solirubrobacterales bacterium]|nr:AMP-binding protein [Solirubrobacterales bacterium]
MAAARFESTTGAHVLQFYGSNENGAISVTSHRDGDDQRLGTAGRPIEPMNVRLCDGEDDVTATGGPGQVATRGPTGCLGYYGDDEANAQLLNADGWMLSGDLATIGDDGFLRLTGRASDLIIRGGKNISAVSVESEAATHPAIALAAAVPARIRSSARKSASASSSSPAPPSPSSSSPTTCRRTASPASGSPSAW